ncbi:zinc metallopeptidase [Thalassoglobus sp.]|uniref:zinc metallopeptidase n=1 Tax=Thalassoglobus sp. TaxID=2795869 RepID=UPI003AA9B0F2
MMPIFDPMYFVFLAPALILMMWAQARIRSTYAKASQVPARLSGAAAARHILDQFGLQDVDIEPIRGHLTDHYDPRHRVLRLSEGVYDGRNAAAIGIAAHEAGHALQHAEHYGPLVIRNMAVPAAQYGPGWFMAFFVLGMFIPAYFSQFFWIGIIGFMAVAAFQLVNLPVEFDASNRAKRLLAETGISDEQSGPALSSVLNAAAWTYVAGTLQSVLVVAYYIMRFGGRGNDN